MLNFPLCKCHSLNFGEIFQGRILLGKTLWDCFGKCHFLLAGLWLNTKFVIIVFVHSLIEHLQSKFVMPNIN
ncbi:hypothetical protein ACE6H2_000796 [Prunus campanulata]